MGGFAIGNAPGAEANARVIERYRELLEARPEPGVVLERLWEAADQEALIAEYKTAAESGDATAALVLGHLLQHAGRNAEALEAFLIAAGLDNARSETWEAAAVLARKTGDVESAAEYLKRAEEVARGDDLEGRVRIATERGRLLAELGKTSEAAEAWESAMQADPANTSLRKTLVEQYLAQGMWEEAEAHLKMLTDSRSPEIRIGALQQLASLNIERGNAPAALQVLKSALDLTAPGNWMRSGIVRDLARIAENAELADETFSAWSARAREEPGNAELSLRVMELAAALGRVTAELEWMEQYLERHPELPEMQRRRPVLLGALGRHGEAAKLLTALCQASSQDAELAFAAAEAEIQAGNVDAGLLVLEQWAKHAEDSHRRHADFLRKNNLPDQLESLLVRRAQTESGNADALLELVEFYAEQGSMERAAEILEEHAANDLNALAVGVRLFLARDELDIARRILTLANGAPGLDELRGEVEERSGNFSEAITFYERAMTASTERDSVDRRIWNVLRAWEDTIPGTRPTRLPWEPGIVDIRAIMEGVEQTEESAESPMRDYLEKITAAASTPEEWVRVAEWNLRAGNLAQSGDAAHKAFAAGADPVKVRGMLAQAAIAQVDPKLAMAQLRLLIEKDPEGAAHYREELAKLVAVESGPEAALDVLESNAEVSKITRAELLQNSQRWYEAVDAWKAILPEVNGQPRARVIEQLVTGLERTGRSAEAMELLWDETISHPPGDERSAMKASLNAFAARQGMTAWVAGRFKESAEQAPQDFALQLETASALRLGGEPDAARGMLPAIYRIAGANLSNLEALAVESSALGDAIMATRVQRQIISLKPAPAVAEYEKLATQQLSLFDVDAAIGTYREMIVRYPRNVDVLVQAAVFFEKLGWVHEALPLRREVAKLAPDDETNTRELGEWLLIRGEDTEAIALWESVLERPSRRDTAKLILPPVPPEVLQPMRAGGHIAARSRGRGHTFAFAVAPPAAMRGGDVLEQDLEAVAHLAILRQRSGDPAALGAWLETLENRDASMAAWALYYAGRGNEFGQLVFDQLDAHPPSNELVQKAVWLTLESGGADAVGEWMGGQTEPDAREMVLGALRVLAGRMPEALTVGLMKSLFPPEMQDAETLWQAAQVCAGAARYEAAMETGMRVLDLSRSNQATYAYELAMWALWRGDKREALRLLRLCLDGPIEGFASVTAAAWRAHFLLLPQEDRPEFVESIAALMGPRTDSAEGDLLLALMEGLQGRYEPALEHLRRRESRGALVATPDGWGTASDEQATQYWNRVFAGAMRVEEWGMYPLARDLLELALADQARVRLDGQAAEAIIAECRLRATSLGVLEYAFAKPDLAEASTALPVLGFSNRLVDQLESFGMHRFALPAAQMALEQSPKDLNIVFGYLKAARAAGQYVEPGGRLQGLLAKNLLEHPEQVQVAMGLAFLWAQFEQMQEIVDLLEPMAMGNPAPLPILTQLRSAHAALGNEAKESALLLKIAEHPDAALEDRIRGVEALRTVDESQAFALAHSLSTVTDPDAASQVMEIFARANSASDVQTFLMKVVAEGNPAVMAAVLKSIAEHLPDYDQRNALLAAMVQAPGWSLRAELNSLHLQQPGTEATMEAVENLHSVSLRAGQSETDVFEFLLKHVSDENLVAKYVQHAENQQANGIQGLEFVLVNWYSRIGDAENLAEVVAKMLEFPAPSRRTLRLTLANLAAGGHFSLAGTVGYRLIQDFPDDVGGHVQRIDLLQKMNEDGEAMEHLELLRAWSIANQTAPQEFAKEFENQGLISEAEIMLNDGNRAASPTQALQLAKARVEFFIRTRQKEKLASAFPQFLRHFGPRDDVDLMRSYLELMGDEGARSLEELTPELRKLLSLPE